MNFLSLSLSFQNAPNTTFNIESHQQNQNLSLNNLFNYKYNRIIQASRSTSPMNSHKGIWKH
jgi:hypothetical protein